MESIHISLQAETIGHVFGLPITNSLILSLLTAFFLVGGGFLVTKSMKLVPEKIQGGGEIIIESILDFMTQVLGNREQALRFFPLVATIFLFVIVSNWVGLLPGTGSIGFTEVHNGEEEFIPLFRAATADLNMTIALAIVAMTTVQIYGVAQLGFFRYLGKFFVFNKGPVYFFVGLLELLSEFTRVLSFSFRLFGNIFAGEVLLIIVAALLPAFLSFGLLPFFFLEFFVGFIQALVFAMLTLIFLKVATTEVEHS